MRYYIYGYTDTGSRDNNEDAVLVNKEIITEGFCESVADAPFITAVCDGVGGENAGELASKLCLQYLSIVDYTSSTDMKQVLMNIHGKIKRRSVREKDAANMQTTLCALAVDEYGKGMCVNVGDSRMYRFVNGTIRQISTDQSYGQYMYNKGVIDDVEELDPKFRKAIISSMGSTRSEPDVVQTPLVSEFGAEPDDMIILTTDGVSDYLTENEFEVGLSMDLPISEKLVALAKLAIMNGSQDNVSIIGIKPFIDFEELAALTRHDAVGKTVDVNAMLNEQPEEDDFDELSDILTIDLDEIIGKHKQTPRPASFVPEEETEEDIPAEETYETEVTEEQYAEPEAEAEQDTEPVSEEEKYTEPEEEPVEQPAEELYYEPEQKTYDYHEPFVFKYQPKENEGFVLPEMPKREAAVIEENISEEPEAPAAVIEENIPEEPEAPAAVIEENIPEEPAAPAAIIEESIPEEPEAPAAVIEENIPEEPEVTAAVIEENIPEEPAAPAAVIEENIPEEPEVTAAIIEESIPEEPEAPAAVIEESIPEEPEAPAAIIEDKAAAIKEDEIISDPAKSVADFFGKTAEEPEKPAGPITVQEKEEPFVEEPEEVKHDAAKSVADFFENGEHGRTPLEYTNNTVSRENYELEAHDLFMQAQASLSKLSTLFPNKKKH